MRIAFPLVVGAALFLSCSPVEAPCGPANCAGCCAPDGACELGLTVSACGSGGMACQTCANGQCGVGGCFVPPTCTPRTCATAGKNCGTIDDGCGQTLNCGSCGNGETCGAGGVNVCGVGTCTAKTCPELNAVCGRISDGCSELLSCGTCGTGLSCVSNQCTCVPGTCSSLGKNCGTVDDGCGGTVECGTCAQGTCGGGGHANVCGSGTCTAATCESLGKNCGSVSDGCGGTLNCGACTLGTCGGGGTANVCGGVCTASCPTGYSCDAYGQCAGGTPTGLAFDVTTFQLSGKVTLNGAAPVDNGSCNDSYYFRGFVNLVDATNGYSFSFPLRSCTGDATFSGTVFPGTYKVSVQGSYSDLPSANYVVNAALQVTAATSGLTYNVATLPVAGKVTLNGAAPVDNGSCNDSYYFRGSVNFVDATNGYSFSFPLRSCTGDATFTGTVFPGTYKVSVQGSYSDLPSANYVVNAALQVTAATSGLTYNVVTLPVTGKVTLNGAAPVDNGSCNDSYYFRGSVNFIDVTNGYSFSLPLRSCTGDATFSGTVFPGTYKVSVQGSYSDLPNANYVVNTALQVTAATSGLTYNVVTLPVTGKVTLNASAPVDNGSCNDSYYFRGFVNFIDVTNGYSFSFPLRSCTGDATFSGTVFPGTYKVSVQGSYSDLPNANYVVNTALQVTAATNGLTYNVVTLPVGGKVTLNGAAPIDNGSCNDSYYFRGFVNLTDATNGYSFSLPLRSCTGDATFSGTVFPGTYKVSVQGSYSDLPNANYVVNASLQVTAATNGLTFNVVTVPISGVVTLNGAAPVDNGSCNDSYYFRGFVNLADAAHGYSFSLPLRSCTGSATFSGEIFPGTYKVAVQGSYSDLPSANDVVVRALVVN